MGFLDKILEIRAKTPSPSDDYWYTNILSTISGQETYSGKRVSETSALENSAFLNGVTIIDNSVASLPFPVYKRLMPRGKIRAQEHYLYDILQVEANPETAAFTFRDVGQLHLLTWGNFFAEIERDQSQRPKGLWQLRPDKMKVYRKKETGELEYLYNTGTNILSFRPDQIFHVLGLSFDGLVGYSPTMLARNTLGITMAAEEYGARFFANNARPGGVITHPNKLSDDAYKRLKKWIKTQHQGLSNAHRMAILEEGMKFESIGLPPGDAQFLETRKFGVDEIARILNIPPHMLKDLERATFSNIEHQGIEFVVYTLTPWLKRWEQEVSRKLLTKAERKVYFAEFLIEGLLRGDTKSRYAAYAIGRQWGWLSANDILEMENRNPIGVQGDIYYMPLNMIDASQKQGEEEESARDLLEKALIGQRAGKKTQQTVALRRRVAKSYRKVFRAAMSRIVRREAKEVRQGLKKNKTEDELRRWITDFYASFSDIVKRDFGPVLESFSEAIAIEAVRELGEQLPEVPKETEKYIKEYLDTFSYRYTNSSKNQLLKILDQKNEAARNYELRQEDVDELEERIGEWEEDDSRANKVANNEIIRGESFIARTIFVLAGVKLFRWAAYPGACKFCSALDGNVVGAESNFIEKDGEIKVGEDTFNSKTDILHPPLHGGCNCSIAIEIE